MYKLVSDSDSIILEPKMHTKNPEIRFIMYKQKQSVQ